MTVITNLTHNTATVEVAILEGKEREISIHLANLHCYSHNETLTRASKGGPRLEGPTKA